MTLSVVFICLLFAINKAEFFLNSSYNLEELIFSAVLELSCIFTSKWKITQSALVLINSKQVLNKKLCSETVGVVTFSVDHKYEVKSPLLCDDANTITYHPTSMLIIIEQNYMELYKVLSNHYRWINYKVGTMLIIFSLELNIDQHTNSLAKLFRVIWKTNIASVTIVCWSRKYKKLNWFTYNGYQNVVHNRTNQYDLTKHLTNISSNLYKYNFKSCFLHDFPRSVLLNYNNGTSLPAGPEGKAFYLMANLLNISTEIVKPIHLSAHETSVFYAKNNMCDVLFASTFRPGYIEGMANTYPLFLDHWCVMLPTSAPITGFKKFIMPFQFDVWCYLIGTLFVIAIFIEVFLISKSHNQIYEDLRFTILVAFGLLLSIGNSIRMHHLLFRTKVVILSISLFGFFVSYAYQSFLFGFLVKPSIQPELHTLKDIGESGLGILVEEKALAIWKIVFKDRNYPASFNKALIGTKYDEYMKMLLSNNVNYGYVASKTRAEYVIQRSRAHTLFYLSKECLVPYVRSYSVACNFPLIERIETLMHRLVDFGFHEHWLSYVGLEKIAFDEKKIDLVIEDITGTKALGLNNLMGLIIIWASVMILCVVVFAGELAWYHIAEKNKLQIN